MPIDEQGMGSRKKADGLQRFILSVMVLVLVHLFLDATLVELTIAVYVHFTVELFIELFCHHDDRAP